MSGGHFNYSYHPEDLDGQWCDEEINELYHDLFCGGDFAVRDYGGLFQSLDFCLSYDIGEEDYLEKVSRFKQKWFRRTPKQRVEFYQTKLQEAFDRYKRELGDA